MNKIIGLISLFILLLSLFTAINGVVWYKVSWEKNKGWIAKPMEEK